MIARTLRTDADYLVVGAVRGAVAEIGPVRDAVERFEPRGVGLGLSADELAGLRDHFIGQSSEPLVELTRHETAEVLGLSRFGEVRVPHPTYIGLVEWADARNVPVEALDPSDDRYGELFTEHIGYFELVRRTLAERRLAREPPDATSAESYALKWDAELATGRGSRAFLAAREETIGRSARTFARRVGRLAVVVDRERFEGVVARLSGVEATVPT